VCNAVLTREGKVRARQGKGFVFACYSETVYRDILFVVVSLPPLRRIEWDTLL
jgi:hypothetical protein